MRLIHCLNNISAQGTDLLDPKAYSLTDSLDEAEGILVRSAAMHDMKFPAGLRAIARAGAGVNNIPLDRCADEGIVVFNTPGANANAVKELVLAALLLTSRKIVPAIEWAQTLKGTADISKQVEKGKSAFAGPEILGKKLGVIGLGAIGVLVANAAQTLGMQVYGFDPFLSVDAAWNLSSDIVKAASVDEIFEKCDYITIHVPLNDSTRGLIGADALKKVKKAVLIALTIYIVLMYLALITKTSSFTYGETQVGYKGWFESGNSIGTIMLLSLFIVLPMLNKENKLAIRIWVLMITVLVGAYLCTLLGTRTGLFGFIIVVMAYIAFTVLYNLLNKNKLNKKILTIGVIILVLVGIAVTIFGSKTIERRRELKNKENEIYDTMTNQTAHVTGDTVELVKKIKAGQMDENYMSESMQQAYLDLYNTANEKQISNTNMRTLQLIYHSNLIKEQNSIPMLLFGNGYMSHYYEMIFEMEVPAFLFNFGVIGFFLYFIPFLIIAVYGIYVILKKFRVVKVEFAMALSGLWFAIIISFLSGYTFFNSSTMMIIIALSVIVINQIKDIDDNEVKIYNPEKGNDTL